MDDLNTTCIEAIADESKKEKFISIRVEQKKISNEKTIFFPKAKPETVARVLLLATHLRYNERLLMRLSSRGRVPMNRKTMRILLRLDSRAYELFLDDATSSGLLVMEEDGSIKLHPAFVYGRVNSDGYHGVPILHLFVDNYTQLLAATSPKAQRILGRIMQLIPYVYIGENVLVWNPTAKTVENAGYLSDADIATLLGFDEKHRKREIKKLLVFCFNSNGKSEYVLVKREDGRYMINPAIIYYGTKRDEIRALPFWEAKNQSV